MFAPPMQDAVARLTPALLHAAAIAALRGDRLHHGPGHAPIDRLTLLGVAGVGQQRSDQGRATRGQRPARRPDVEGRDMPMPHVLLVHGIERHLFQRKLHLDEPLVGHGLVVRSNPRAEESLNTSNVILESRLPRGDGRIADENFPYRIRKSDRHRLGIASVACIVIEFR